MLDPNDAYDPDREPSGEPEALLLGALVGWKRPRLALEAVALAARELPDIKLTIWPILSVNGDKREYTGQNAPWSDEWGSLTGIPRNGGGVFGGSSE